MLEIKNLSLYLKKDLRPLIRDFSFSFGPRCRAAALIGEEGNGKSTLLKAIACPERITSYVDISGEINRSDEVIGYLPQTIGEGWGERSALSILRDAVPWQRFDYSAYYRNLATLGLDPDIVEENGRAKDLSGGEKIKFALLLELMKEPTLLLLDEPSNDLDLDSLALLEQFILHSDIPILFVSHEEELLAACADTIIHFEQLIHKTVPRHTVARQGYREYVAQRNDAIAKQNQLAKKEKAEYDARMKRYQRIYERVQYELRTVSRGDPQTARNLKDKMHAVKSTGRRFEREKENMTPKRVVEDAIAVAFDEDIVIPKGKVLLDYEKDALRAGDRVLARHLRLHLAGGDKICVVGPNGSGKTTLLRDVMKELEDLNVRCGYMPQEYDEALDAKRSPVTLIAKEGTKEELTRIRTYLGSLHFTAEEMMRPVGSLSGGQKAKLYFAKMILDKAQFLILDEPTRNLSPLSGPEIRRSLRDFSGGILAVSHDRAFIREVFDRVLVLTPEGLHDMPFSDL